MLTVLSPAASRDLTTLAVVRTEVDAGDADLIRYITQASAVIAAACDRVFGAETVTETLRGRCPADDLVLTRFPVTAIASVTENGTALDPTDYECDLSAGTLIRLRSGRPCPWPSGSVVVEYTAGYDLPTGTPEPLARATMLLVRAYAAEEPGNPRLRREEIDGIGAMEYFRATDSGLPIEVEALIVPFRRIPVA